MDGARQEVGLVSGRNILPKLVLKEKKFNAFGHKFKDMAQEGWICPRCGKVNAPWVMQCSCNRSTQILPKVGAPYYEGDQVTCDTKENKQ